MASILWLKRLVRSKVVWSTVQCAFWAIFSIHEWREHPDGLFFWLCIIIVALSAIALWADIVIAGGQNSKLDFSSPEQG
jgi:hypothetical protein